MSIPRFQRLLWRQLSQLLSQKQNVARSRKLFRRSLLEQFEKREMMAYDVSSIRLLNDTGISSTDKITYDPTLTGTVSSGTGGSSGMSGGYGGFGVLHVQFDHNGDGVGDGSVIVSDGNFATLHHLGQDARGPLAEASTRYHGVGKPGQDILHSQYGRNQPHPTHQPDRKKFGVDTREYWRWRVANEYSRTR